MKQPYYHHEFNTLKSKKFFVCAYKLERILLHNGVNPISLINFSNVSTTKVEKEATKFSTYLLSYFMFGQYKKPKIIH